MTRPFVPETRTAMTGGAAIVEGLMANGVDTVFGLPGAQMYPLFDALQVNAGRIRTIGARHEQTCGYMAFGYARSTGRPGVYAVVPGPGMLNTTAALVTAWGCCAPVLCLTGQVPSDFLGARRGHLHEIPDQLATLRTLTKWAERIERPADAPELVAEAFRQMLSGRPGPVALEMAWDVMGSSEAVPPAFAARIDPPTPADAAAVAAAAAILKGARRPMIFTGSGAQHAADEIGRLAGAIGAPVVGFRGGRGVVDEAGPHGLSSYAASRYYGDCDVVVAIGTRLELPTMRWTGMMRRFERLDGGRKLIRIDVDPEEAARLKADVDLTTDAALGAAALVKALAGSKAPETAAAIETARAEAAAETASVQPHMGYLAAIRGVLPPEGILVEELSQTGFTSYFGYPAHRPRTYISTGFQGTLGFGFPTALGVKAAHPDTPVVSITGDGGFMFAVQELATARQYGLALVTVVFNNGAYGNVRRDQETRFGNRIIGADLVNPDFMQLAGAFGVAGQRVRGADELAAALAEAIRRNEPALIEVTVTRETEVSPWPFIHATPRKP